VGFFLFANSMETLRENKIIIRLLADTWVADITCRRWEGYLAFYIRVVA